MQALPDVLAHRARKSPASLVPGMLIDAAVVSGPWKHLVFGFPAPVDRNAYTFCVLEQFWRHLKRREIYAGASTRWRNPQAELLDGAAWEAVKEEALTTLGLPEDPGALLVAHIRTLDAACREVGGRPFLPAGGAGSTGDQLLGHIRQWAQTLYHPAGTCAMGTGETAVVDPQLRVRGIGNLRVVDASVMPAIPRGNTNAPVIMIAEKAADLIRGLPALAIHLPAPTIKEPVP